MAPVIVGLNRTGHMSFLSEQDRTPKFAGQVLPDGTESGLIYSNIYIVYRLTKKKFKKKNLEKKIFCFFLIFSIIKGPESRKEKKPEESGHLKYPRISGPDVMSG